METVAYPPFLRSKEYRIFLTEIGLNVFAGSLFYSNCALDEDNINSFIKWTDDKNYREDYLATKEWFDILRSHNFQLPTKKVDKLISIHKQMSNLK